MLAKLRLLSAIVLVLTLPLLTDASVVDSDAAQITLPLAKRVNTTGTAKLLESDQARARAFRARAEGKWHHRRPPPVPVNNTAVVYVAPVNIDGQVFDLLVDTGSSNTWVGAGQQYNTTGKTPEDQVAVFYGSGFFFGDEYTATARLGPGLVIKNQSFGDAYFSFGFEGYDGILGIGPTDLTIGTLYTSNASIPTVTDNAYNQGLIRSKKIGISFAPTSNLSDPNGELTFGYVNQDKYTGSVNYVPITSTSPSSSYVGINQTITYGNGHTPILGSKWNSSAGIVDTGTTLVILATDAYEAYVTATGATLDDDTGLLKITQAQYDCLESLHFHIGHATYEFTPNAQIWPRTLNTAIGGVDDAIYLIVGDLGSPSGEGLDFISGFSWLERFYHVYDSDRNRAGFATTCFTHATTN
ncbi:acid protease [Polyporus arcularius HHB13444]|uniref:Acid protease n=1 Tax=Polyporus arcularius HHB13444 TaxID=1314778 RepID=A0A5C3PNU8_9APHY|nr:acid protease [Polyporus arcularius HHB13444]